METYLKHPVTLALAVLLALSGIRGAPLHAQSWSFIDLVGYGAAGGGLGFALTVEADCSDIVCGQTVFTTLGGLALGAVGGAIIGSRAQSALDRGEALTPGHRNAVAAGTVFAGAALGGVTSFLLINSEGEGTFLGSDEQTFGMLALAGAGLGALYVASQWAELSGQGLELRPAVLSGRRLGIQGRLEL